MLPSGPVVSAGAMDGVVAHHIDDQNQPVANYTGESRLDFPLIPFQVFGFFYDIDVVLVSRHDAWDMHEYARIQTPNGPLWIAKDSDKNGVQTVMVDEKSLEQVSGLSGATALQALVAETPVPRKMGEMVVEDRSTDQRVDLHLAYDNPAGQPVEVWYRGKLPSVSPRLRNGSTMGHSQQTVAAVLDLERFKTTGRGKIYIDGQRVPLKRILGLVPMRFLLRQDQAGVAVTSFAVEPMDGGGFQLVRPAGADEVDPVTAEPGWPTRRLETWQVLNHVDGAATTELDGQTAVFDNGINKFSYHFVNGGLQHAKVEQWGRDKPVMEMLIDPPLPDVSRPFEGEWESAFRIDVNGQVGHGIGVIKARCVNADVVELTMTPTEPWWFADRPMVGRIDFDGDSGRAQVQMVRVGAVGLVSGTQ